jgi:hypothetical protein
MIFDIVVRAPRQTLRDFSPASTKSGHPAAQWGGHTEPWQGEAHHAFPMRWCASMNTSSSSTVHVPLRTCRSDAISEQARRPPAAQLTVCLRGGGQAYRRVQVRNPALAAPDGHINSCRHTSGFAWATAHHRARGGGVLLFARSPRDRGGNSTPLDVGAVILPAGEREELLVLLRRPGNLAVRGFRHTAFPRLGVACVLHPGRARAWPCAAHGRFWRRPLSQRPARLQSARVTSRLEVRPPPFSRWIFAITSVVTNWFTNFPESQCFH